MRDFLLSCGYPKERLDVPIKDLNPPPEWHLIRVRLDPEYVNHELVEAGVISEVWQTYWVDTGALVELDSDYWTDGGPLGYVLIPGKIVIFSGDSKEGWREHEDDISEIEQSGSSPDNADWISVDEFNFIPEDDRCLQFEMKDCKEYPQYDLDDPIADLFDRLVDKESGNPTWC